MTSQPHARLPQTLIDQGRPVRPGGHERLLLEDPSKAWIIRHGGVELFAVEAEEGTEGSRHHLASLSVDSLLLGLPSDRAEHLCLLAQPLIDSEFLEVPIEALMELAEEAAHRPLLVALLESWLAALSQGIAAWTQPRPRISESLAAGRSQSLEAGVRVGSQSALTWLRGPGNGLQFLDTQSLADDDSPLCFPLSAEAWLTTTAPVELVASETASLLVSPGTRAELLSGIGHLHRVVLRAIAHDLQLAAISAADRLTARRASNDGLRDQAFSELMSVTRRRDAGVSSTTGTEAPLVTALRLIGQELGFSVHLPSDQAPGAPPTISSLTQASGVRARALVLRDHWWLRDFGALLVFDAESGAPRVALSNGRRQALLIDPVTGDRQPLAPERLAPAAWEFTPSLPFRALSFGQFFGRGVKAAATDLWAVLLLGVIGAILGLATPVATGYLIDRVIPDQDLSLLLQLGMVLLVLAATTFVVSYTTSLAYTRAESRMGRQLQSGLMDRVLRLPMPFFQGFSTGDLASRVMGLSQIQTMLSTASTSTLLGGLVALFSFALMFHYDVHLALWAGLVTLIYSLISLLIAYRLLLQQRQLATLNGQLSDRVLQMILGIAKIRLAAAETRAFSQWAAVFAQDRRHQLASQRLIATQTALDHLLVLAGLLIFALVIGQPSNSYDLLAIGAFSALLVTYQRFASHLTSLLQVATRLLGIQPLLERARPLLTTAPETAEGRPDAGRLSGEIEVSHIRFRYRDDGPLILNDVTLRVPAGHFVALVGASGSGKSTLMRLLLGFETPESGGIFFDGKALSTIDVGSVRRQMGVVMQNANVMPGSLFENIVGPSGGSLEDAWAAARQVGLAEDIEQMPMGMQTMILEGGGALSGGQMQRLMIARAIVGRPKILLLDEATSALDNRTQAVVTESLDRLRITRLVVAHRLSTVINADQIYVMDAGQVIETGTYDELMEKGGHFADLARRQQMH
ncbi:NHLP bacteriocin export ABC transporter permease/ATPase subunit [Thiohalocapsa marina]|uniref:NHLP bacteriocin export ABC transporter permease/ATPase subunit n=1 Tax=Thiohalocapsa marina TaxID=424902 RepID=UPI0036DC4786